MPQARKHRAHRGFKYVIDFDETLFWDKIDHTEIVHDNFYFRTLIDIKLISVQNNRISLVEDIPRKLINLYNDLFPIFFIRFEESDFFFLFTNKESYTIFSFDSICKKRKNSFEKWTKDIGTGKAEGKQSRLRDSAINYRQASRRYNRSIPIWRGLQRVRAQH